MISRRNFLALLPAVPPVCKAMLAHNAEWHRFAHELSHALGNLREREFLILETKCDGYYVQFAGQGSFGMWAESVSNGYLDGDRRLSEKACSKLMRLGWKNPTIIPDPVSDVQGYKGYGSPNYFVDFPAPVPYRFVASLAVSTLRSVFKARHPRELRLKPLRNTAETLSFQIFASQ